MNEYPNYQDFGWEFWADAELVFTIDDGRLFKKDGWTCFCPPGVEPGDADSIVRKNDR